MAVYLIDYENINQQGLIGGDALTKDDKVIIFYSSQKIGKDMSTYISLDCEISYVKLKKVGKNGLDFYIATMVGDILGKNKDEEISIISKDTGYEAIRDFTKIMYGVDISIASNIITGKYLLSKSQKNALIIGVHKGEEEVGIKEFQNIRKNKVERHKNMELNDICKLVVNKDLLNIYNSSKTSMELYNKLLHNFGKKEGHRIYTCLKENDITKESIDKF